VRGLWKKMAFRAMIGFAIGVLVGTGFLASAGIRNYYTEYGIGRFALYLILSGVLGAVNVGTTILYDFDEWSLARSTLTHFCITMTTLCAIGFPMRWFSLHDPVTWWMFLIFVVIYFIIWLVLYLKYRREVRQINSALKDWKDTHNDSLDP